MVLMSFKRVFSVFVVVAIIIAMAQPVMALALWKDDVNVEMGTRTFQCSEGGGLEISFFDIEELQLNFFELDGEFYVDDIKLKDDYLKAGMTDAGNAVSAYTEPIIVNFAQGRFGRFELIVMPGQGYAFDRFVDAGCHCAADLQQIEGKYHVDVDTKESEIEAVFERATDIGSAVPTINMTVNGVYIYTDVPPFIENDRTMVPARFIGDALGATAAWDDETRVVSITAPDGMIIKLMNGDVNMHIIRGESITIVQMDVTTIIKDGRTFVPVRFIAEALGLEVEWINETRTVSLWSEEHD